MNFIIEPQESLDAQYCFSPQCPIKGGCLAVCSNDCNIVCVSKCNIVTP